MAENTGVLAEVKKEIKQEAPPPEAANPVAENVTKPPSPAREQTLDEYKRLIKKMVPHIAHTVDKAGGLMSIATIAENRKVKDALAQICDPHETRLTRIVAEYADFFAILEGGYLATYKAYDTGLVDQNNNVIRKPSLPTTAKIAKIAEEKQSAFAVLDHKTTIDYESTEYAADTKLHLEDESDPSGIRALLEKRIQDGYQKPEDDSIAPIIMNHDGKSKMELALENTMTNDDLGQDMTLTDAVDQFYQSAFNEDSYCFFQAFQKIRKLRQTMFSVEDHDNVISQCGIKINANQFAEFGHVRVFPHRQKGNYNVLTGQQMGHHIESHMPYEDLSKEEHRDRNTLVLRECVTQLFKAATKTSTMVLLSQHPKIMALKKGVVTKLTGFFDQHGDKFMRYTNPNGATKSECIELIMHDNDVAKFMADTQELHDRYLQSFPEIMTAEPVISTQPSKKKRKKANREARELAAKAREAGVDIH